MARLLAVAVAIALARLAPAQSPTWAGTWFTTQGVMVLRQTKAAVEGDFGKDAGKVTLAGTASGRVLTFRWRAGAQEGEGSLQLDSSGHAFDGTWRAGAHGALRGWRQDPKANQGAPSKLAGTWRTSWGMLELEQKGTAAKGILGAAGWTEVEGNVRGRRLSLRYRGPMGQGTLWAEVREGGKTLCGGVEAEQGGRWTWLARKLEGHAREPALRPGAIVDGLGSNRLTYHVRAPAAWRKGSKWPAIVFLHGSNFASRPYLDTIAGKDGLGDRFVIIGIDGEQWNDDSPPDDPRHNYTYVNWMGKSTYQGYPNTERESPALVADLIRELKQKLGLGKVFVGGHSQGGFLAWFFAMHFPDLVDGVFPIAAGLVIQNEPDVFADEGLRAAQRRLPIAVVHGEHDEAVPFAQGKDAHERLLEFGFPAARLFAAKAPHAFIALPWAEAIAWLEALASDDVDALLAFAEERAARGEHRDACAALRRVRDKKPTPAQKERADAVMATVDAAARPDAERLEQAMAQQGAVWIDDFLAFRASFEFADAAQGALRAFAALRQQHEPAAAKLLQQARAAFQAGRRDEGWAKYEELVQRYYASSSYARAKRWLADRK